MTFLMRVNGELRKVRANSFMLAVTVARMGYEYRHGPGGA
jgi:hypothetical protein